MKFNKKQLRRVGLLVFVLAAIVFFFGFEWLVSDIATRVRYSLRDEAVELRLSSEQSRKVSIQPDRWPDGCANKGNYTLTISPYQGNKQTPAADINVQCEGGRHYWTGTDLIVNNTFEVKRNLPDPIEIVITKTEKGIEITDLH